MAPDQERGRRLRETTFRNLGLHKHFGRAKSSHRDFEVRRLRHHGQDWPRPLLATWRLRHFRSKCDKPLHPKASLATGF